MLLRHSRIDRVNMTCFRPKLDAFSKRAANMGTFRLLFDSLMLAGFCFPSAALLGRHKWILARLALLDISYSQFCTDLCRWHRIRPRFSMGRFFGTMCFRRSFGYCHGFERERSDSQRSGNLRPLERCSHKAWVSSGEDGGASIRAWKGDRGEQTSRHLHALEGCEVYMFPDRWLMVRCSTKPGRFRGVSAPHLC